MPHLVEHHALDAAIAAYIAERKGDHSAWGPTIPGWYVLDDDGKVLAGPFRELAAAAELEDDMDEMMDLDIGTADFAKMLVRDYVVFRRVK